MMRMSLHTAETAAGQRVRAPGRTFIPLGFPGSILVDASSGGNVPNFSIEKRVSKGCSVQALQLFVHQHQTHQ